MHDKFQSEKLGRAKYLPWYLLGVSECCIDTSKDPAGLHSPSVFLGPQCQQDSIHWAPCILPFVEHYMKRLGVNTAAISTVREVILNERTEDLSAEQQSCTANAL